MRPIANFTIHAILAAALAALAATSAAAGKFDAWLELGDIRGEEGDSAHKDTRDQHIELLSYSFGASGVSKVEGFTIKQGVARQRSDASAGKGASNEMAMDDTAGREKMQPGGGSASGVGVKRVFVKSWSTSGDASAERTHKPLRMRMEYDGGNVTLNGRFPACRVGAAYPAATVGQGDERYEMRDVTVASCSPESMSLSFKKVTVRGWDPEKKEE